MHLATPHAADATWLRLRATLWPQASDSEHLHDMAEAIARGHFVRLAVDHTDGTIAFVEASKRVDYVNGTTSSPVAFLEGLYVVPDWRRQGVGSKLVRAVEDWAISEGCLELASDSPVDNLSGHAAHLAWGFVETERVVYFCRRLNDG